MYVKNKAPHKIDFHTIIKKIITKCHNPKEKKLQSTHLDTKSTFQTKRFF